MQLFYLSKLNLKKCFSRYILGKILNKSKYLDNLQGLFLQNIVTHGNCEGPYDLLSYVEDACKKFKKNSYITLTSLNLGASFLASKNKEKVYGNETTKGRGYSLLTLITGNNKIAEYNPLRLVSLILMSLLSTVDIILNVI